MKNKIFKIGDIVVPTDKMGNGYNLENLKRAEIVSAPQPSHQTGNFSVTLKVLEGYFMYRTTKYAAPQIFGLYASSVKLEFEGDEDYEFF